MVLITSLAIQSISYGIEDTGKDTTSIIFGVAKKINDSIIVHYETTKKTDVSDLKIVEAKLLEHTEFINKKKVSLDLATLIAFCAEAFYLNDNVKNKPVGYLPKKSTVDEKPSTPMEALLFVSSELNHDNKESLVFISSVSPARFTVFSIDKSYNIKILYDTFQKNILRNTSIGSIENIEVVKKGVFIASERDDILNNRLWPEPRKILITRDKDAFNIEIVGDEKASGNCK
jgi:hypothetical protein